MDERALQGGILPPVSSYWELKRDEQTPDTLNNTLEASELLHNMKPVDAMTEEHNRIYHNERYTRTHLERLG